MFVKGQSGNPTGGSKKTQEWKALVQEASKGCLENIKRIAADVGHPDTLKANIWISEQAWGKSSQQVDVAGDISLTVNLIKK